MKSELTPPTSTEDELFSLVTRASALQQSGLEEEAIALYQELREIDPHGRYGSIAQKSIESLQQRGKKSVDVTQPMSFRGINYKATATETNPTTIPLVQGLLNMPIRQKQLFSLFASELVSVVGLLGVGAVLIVTSLRAQLVSQAKSELAVTQINYNIKIDQMGFGFRGQSDNTAIISAALTRKTSPQVLDILKNEVEARQIEYATLVDRNAIVLASANADRTGQTFNPNDLVTAAFASGKQIKATEIVSWKELQTEKPPLPPTVNNSDALIRYTVTPVRNPANASIVGALISGDIVNGKPPIVQRTLEAFDVGYSAVYLRTPANQFQLAIASQQKAEEEPLPNVPLPDLSLLQKATETPGEPVTGRLTIEGQGYTLAAKAIVSQTGEPTAILVRGTPETQLNRILQQGALWQALGTMVVILVDLGLAAVLKKAIADPILNLKDSAEKLAAGDTSVRAAVISKDEVGQLAETFNQMADRVQARTEEVQRLASQREQEAIQQRKQTEQLQRRVVELLLEIEGAQHGDLTVRARVTDDEMGSIADAFNATVSSLRQLVTQVQQVAQEVNLGAAESEASVSQLSVQALDQAESIATALRSVESMAQSIETVANSAMETARIAKEASTSASQGGVAMQQTVESIEELRSSVAETAKKVKRLTESSQEISKIVALISEISAKTNLLAFNASIEAVRAGEHGQGFRIVADEVRRLAERVSESTKDIEQLVSGIQLETAEVLTMMEKGTTQVVTSSKLVDQTRETLLSLVSISQKIDQFVQSISDSTHRQNEMSQQVSHTMQSIAQTAEGTSQESQQVCHSLKNLLAVAEALQASIAKFRVNQLS
ncbi:MAG: methyl-accepting chemotaxis protein [Prochlorotrichaceae cyanobacterium]|jgi:twitching motility protein PilJ